MLDLILIHNNGNTILLIKTNNNLMIQFSSGVIFKIIRVLLKFKHQVYKMVHCNFLIFVNHDI